MQAVLTINNVDFAPWVAEDGLEYSEDYRQSRDVVTLDGNLYRSQIAKTTIDVELVEIRDSTLAKLALALTSPATVQYSTRSGSTASRTFYVSDVSYGAKTVRGGNTYYSGVGFTLEER